MKLAEALQERKTQEKEIEQLWEKLHHNLFRPEDEAIAEDDPAQVTTALDAACTRVERLTVAINATNNASQLDGRGITIMQAIAQRDRLNRQVKGWQGCLRTGIFGGGRPSRRTSKDDIKYVPTVDLKALKAKHDSLAADLRQLDLDLQKANWSVDLIE